MAVNRGLNMQLPGDCAKFLYIGVEDEKENRKMWIILVTYYHHHDYYLYE